MFIKRRRNVKRVGPFRINRTGYTITSVTVPIPFWRTLVVWERDR